MVVRCLVSTEKNRVKILAEDHHLEIVVDGGLPRRGLEIAVFFKIEQMEYGIADQPVGKIIPVQDSFHYRVDNVGVSNIGISGKKHNRKL